MSATIAETAAPARIAAETAAPARIAVTDAHEGPVRVPDEDALYFTSSRPRAAIMRLVLATGAVTAVRAAGGNPNGMALSADGALLVCEQGSFEAPARIAHVDRRTGAARTIVDAWGGAPLNSPNDVVVAPDGALWFTDPSYGHLQGFRSPPALGDHVYRHDLRTGRTDLVADGFGKPNGLVFSPDGQTLYVGDSERDVLEAFDVDDGPALGRRRRFAAVAGGHPDGLEVDHGGRVYAATEAGVQVFSPAGTRVGVLPVPGAVHLTWRDLARRHLLITADTAIWAASTTHLQEA
jgi:gluconolactonase